MIRRSCLTLAMESGNPITYWEEMPLTRLRDWIRTWNLYIGEKNAEAQRKAQSRNFQVTTGFPRRF